MLHWKFRQEFLMRDAADNDGDEYVGEKICRSLGCPKQARQLYERAK
jgi:hypothetical protein